MPVKRSVEPKIIMILSCLTHEFDSDVHLQYNDVLISCPYNTVSLDQNITFKFLDVGGDLADLDVVIFYRLIVLIVNGSLKQRETIGGICMHCMLTIP